MSSVQSQSIRDWLFKNIKNAPAASSVNETRSRIEAFENHLSLSAETEVELIKDGLLPQK